MSLKSVLQAVSGLTHEDLSSFTSSIDPSVLEMLRMDFGLDESFLRPSSTMNGNNVFVGMNQKIKTLDEAIASSKPSDNILLESGSYTLTTSEGWTIPHDLSLIGLASDVKLVTDVPVKKGMIVTDGDVNLKLTNLDISGQVPNARSFAAVHHAGQDLSIYQSRIHNAPIGVQAKANPKGHVQVIESDFYENGLTDEMLHDLWVESGAALFVSGSHFYGGGSGDQINSQAVKTAVIDSILDGTDAATRFNVNLGNNTKAVVAKNTIVQNPYMMEDYLINLWNSGDVDLIHAYIEENTFISHQHGTTAVHAPGETSRISENSFYGFTGNNDSEKETDDNSKSNEEDQIETNDISDNRAEKPLLDVPSKISVSVDDEEGTQVSVPVSSSLRDKDGSELLNIYIRDVPNGVKLSAGEFRGGGEWKLLPRDLDGLMFDLPPTLDNNFTIEIAAVAVETGTQVNRFATTTGEIHFFIDTASPEPSMGPSGGLPNGLVVGAGGHYQDLAQAIAASNSGDIIYVKSGTYNIGEITVSHDLSIIGVDGNVVLTSSASVPKGLLVTASGVDLYVENLTFQGATSPSKNGAGIRHQGDHLTVVNSRFIDNENGILASDNASSVITVKDSYFSNNGYGDGFSHGLYVNHIDQLLISGTTFEGTNAGHHVKSLANFTSITDSVLDDAGGTASYNIDASRGGDLYVANSTLIQSAATQNSAMINYSLERGGSEGSVDLVNNDFINHRPNGIALKNATDSVANLEGNTFTDNAGGFVTHTGSATITDGSGDSGSGSGSGSGGDSGTGSGSGSGGDSGSGSGSGGDSGPGSGSGGDSGSGSGGGVDISPPSGNGDIVSMRLTNTSGSNSSGDVMTFGQVFDQGHVPSGQGLVAHVNGQTYAVQMDVKATYDDGSVRHAVLTLDAPALNNNQSVDITLAHGNPPTGANLTAQDILDSGYNVTVQVTLSGGSTQYINVANKLNQAMANGTLDTWVEGPLSSEYSFQIDVVPHLDLRFNIQIMADGDVRTNVIFANDDVFEAGSHDLTYSATIKDHGAVVASYNNIDHYRSSTWNEEFWTGQNPSYYYQHDMDYLMTTGAIPHYDTSLGVDPSEINQRYQDLQNQDTGPLGSAMITEFMGMTGGREDIGILPTWTATYIISQDQKSWEIMMANADAAGSVPWHLIDSNTGEAITITDHPTLRVDRSGNVLSDAYRSSSNGGWTIDNAHQPSVSYVPYLLTGNQYYLDNLINQTSYSIGLVPDYFRGSNGLVFGANQPRGDAWLLRTMSEVSFVIPDQHALHDYFDNLLNVNLDHLVQKYVVDGHMDHTGELEGWFDFKYQAKSSEVGLISAWQQDFFTSALSLASARGYDQAIDLLNWQANFTAGRFINDDNGFDIDYGALYRLAIGDASTGAHFNTWSESLNQMLSSGRQPFDYNNQYAHDYLTKATNALSSMITATGNVEAIEAYGNILSKSFETGPYDPNADATYFKDPTWFFAPVLPDGSTLTQDKITIGSGSLNGTAESELIYGGSGADTIKGVAGSDLLFGDSGADDIQGNAGNDYLFGGAGNDKLAGHSGDDVLKGNGGADQFVFTAFDNSHDQILDFTDGQDRIVLWGELSNGVSLTNLLANATSSGGDTTLHFDANTSVTLIGVSISDLSVSDFILV